MNLYIHTYIHIIYIYIYYYKNIYKNYIISTFLVEPCKLFLEP